MPDAAQAKKPSSRIATFDLLRGYFLIVILCNHLNLYPNIFAPITGESILYVSTAEGFFLISGIVLGIVRGQKLLHRPFREAAGKLLKRSLQLYVTSVVLALVFTLIAWALAGHEGLKGGVYEPRGDVWGLLWNTLTYQYLYGWADFLRQYAIFIFFSPIALWLLRKGKWYIVTAISALVWTLFPLSTADGTMSQPISWQFIFFSGFVIGFHWNHLTAWWRTRLAPVARKRIGKSLAIAFLVTAATSAALVFGERWHTPLGDTLGSIHHGIEWMFNKDRMPIPRLILGAIWFWGLFWIVRRYEDRVIKWFGWLLQSFGENSLYVYTLQSFLVFFANILLAQISFKNEFFANTLITSALIALVYLAIRTKFLMKIIPR